MFTHGTHLWDTRCPTRKQCLTCVSARHKMETQRLCLSLANHCFKWSLNRRDASVSQWMQFLHVASLIARFKMDTEDFISEIENEPAIWNSSVDEYSNKVYKKSAWERVINKFYPDFEEKSATEKNKIGDDLQRKWKSLRNSFSRELLNMKKEKSGQGANCRKQYIYFQQLQFLQTAAKTTTSSIPEEETQNSEAEEIQELDPNEMAESREIYTRQKKTPKTSSKRKEKDADEELLEVVKKRIATSEYQQSRNDADEMFMLSLVPELRNVPEHLKLQAKCELMHVFQKFKVHNLQHNLQPHPSNFNINQQYNHNPPYQQSTYAPSYNNIRQTTPVIPSPQLLASTASSSSNSQYSQQPQAELPLHSPESNYSMGSRDSFIDFDH